jgi:hypothetical protein
MTESVDPVRLVARTLDQIDDVTSLIRAADMACADLENEPEQCAIKAVLYAARKRLDSARDTIEAVSAALAQERSQ